MKSGRWFTSLLALFALLAALGGSARAEFPPKDLVVPSLVADTTALTPGKPFTVGVRFKITPGWHTYWEFAGDAGFAPKIDWHLPEGFTAGPIQWPIPTPETDDEDLTFIYSDELLLPVQITPPAKLEAGKVTLSVSLRWLVCQKTCIPGKGEVSLELPVGGDAAPANAELFAQWNARLPKVGAPFKVSWDRSKPDFFSLQVAGAPADRKLEFYPLPPEGVIPGHAKVNDPSADGARSITVPIKDGGAANLPWRGLIVASSPDGKREAWLVSPSDPVVETAATPAAPAAPAATAPAFGLGAFGTDSQEDPTAAIIPSLVSETTAITPGKPFTVGVLFKLAPGWYTYWEFGGDAGFPASLNWQLPPGFKAGPIQWPTPITELKDGELTYVYRDELLLPVEITPPADLPAGEVTLGAGVNCLVCKKICVPRNATVSLTLPVGKDAATANTELFAKWQARLPKSGAPFKVSWDRSKADSLSLHIDGLPADHQLEFYPLPPKGVTPGHPAVSAPATDGSRSVTLPITSGGGADLPWRGVLATSTANGPREGWLVSATEATPPPPVAASTPAVSSATPSTSASTTPPDSRGLPGILFFAFLGGLILNVMPCVLPVIALKIFGFVQQAGEDPKRVFRLGLAFVSGVFLFFLGLAVAVIALKAAGRNFNWGFQFQNPYVFAGLIALVFVFGLNLLGVFEITLSSETASTLSTLSSREGYGGAFLHGMFTTLLGTSCTAPFLSASLGYATTQSPVTVLAIFLTIATGMSLPYLLLTAKPAWLRFLPKPGAWMERAKQLMGFVMLTVAVWLLGVFAVSRPESAAGLIHYLLVLALACWLFGIIRTRWAAVATAAILTLGGYFFLLQSPLQAQARGSADAGETVSKDGLTWRPFSEERLNDSVRRGQPVFIDFTADWCINCKVYEHAVLDTDAIRAALRDKKVLTLRADWTNGDPMITQWLKRFGRIGVPLYILYRPGEAQPVVLDALTKQILLDQLALIKG
jgi:thiol:disulfide interchange protein/DsbC/DsbD-like thiol-disulfide interchange protein